MSLTREEARQFVNRHTLVNGIPTWVTGVTETHVIGSWPETREPLALELARVQTMELVELECSNCGATVPVLHGEEQTCTECTRKRGHSTPPRPQPCDDCGTTERNVWRDPITRKNEYFCSTCHAKRGRVFLNRWAPRVSQPLVSSRDNACEARNVPGTVDCSGSVRPRGGATKRMLCNAHAGIYRVEGG